MSIIEYANQGVLFEIYAGYKLATKTSKSSA